MLIDCWPGVGLIPEQKSSISCHLVQFISATGFWAKCQITSFGPSSRVTAELVRLSGNEWDGFLEEQREAPVQFLVEVNERL